MLALRKILGKRLSAAKSTALKPRGRAPRQTKDYGMPDDLIKTHSSKRKTDLRQIIDLTL